ncbi:MAG: cupredoxin family copper-binding protein [Solirubrobacteraceae bacterium]
MSAGAAATAWITAAIAVVMAAVVAPLPADARQRTLIQGPPIAAARAAATCRSGRGSRQPRLRASTRTRNQQRRVRVMACDAAHRLRRRAATRRRTRARDGAPNRPARRPRAAIQAAAPRARPAGRQRGAPAGDPGVAIADFDFSPGTTTIHVGDTVTWTNGGPSSHTATARDGSFNTGVLKKGASASHTFTAAGTFSYFCEIHPFMHGTIVVLAAVSKPSTAAPSTAAPSTPASAATSASTTPATALPQLPLTGLDLTTVLCAGLLLGTIGVAIHAAVTATADRS